MFREQRVLVINLSRQENILFGCSNKRKRHKNHVRVISIYIIPDLIFFITITYSVKAQTVVNLDTLKLPAKTENIYNV